jgi:hypothetical protein
MAASYRRFGQFGLLALMAIMFLKPGLFGTLMSPVYWAFEAILAVVGGGA